MSTLVIVLILFFSFTLFSLLINLKWCVKTIRDIAKDQIGYTKFIQICLVCLLSSIFLIIIFYYILNPSKVDRIDIILTVIVGWLGAVIGSFFGEKAMVALEDKRKINVSNLLIEMNNKDIIIEELSNILKKK